jgi:hypothetical protein
MTRPAFMARPAMDSRSKGNTVEYGIVATPSGRMVAR